MTYYIYQVSNEHRPQIEYFFCTDQGHWSSDFHSLEQLCDVGLDDPDLKHNRRDFISALVNASPDVHLLFSTPTLDINYVSEHFPEYFI